MLPIAGWSTRVMVWHGSISTKVRGHPDPNSQWGVYTSERAGVSSVVAFGPWVEARTEDGSHVGEQLPKWVNRAVVGSKATFLIVDSRGWPFPTLYSVTNLEDKPISAGGFPPLPPLRSGTLRGTSDALPFRPIWTAFASNTLFYAAILWLLIPGPFVLRRFLRVRRGLCPKCAYPIGESAICSECGITLPRRRRMPNLT